MTNYDFLQQGATVLCKYPDVRVQLRKVQIAEVQTGTKSQSKILAKIEGCQSWLDAWWFLPYQDEV